MTELSLHDLNPRDQREERMAVIAYNIGVAAGKKTAQERIDALQAQVDGVSTVHWRETVRFGMNAWGVDPNSDWYQCRKCACAWPCETAESAALTGDNPSESAEQ